MGVQIEPPDECRGTHGIKTLKNNHNVSRGHLSLGDCASDSRTVEVLGSITNQPRIVREGHVGWCCHAVTLGRLLHKRTKILL